MKDHRGKIKEVSCKMWYDKNNKIFLTNHVTDARSKVSVMVKGKDGSKVPSVVDEE